MLDFDSVVKSSFNKDRNIKKEVLTLDDYEIIYYRQRDNKDFAIFDNGDSLIHFNSKEELKEFIVNNVVKGTSFYPDIFFRGSNLLKDYSDEIAYHLSLTCNRESILNEGLIPNKSLDLDTLATNVYLDRFKPRKLPKNFYKSLSIYLYPEYFLSSSEQIASVNIDLYGVDISGLDWRIGSQFLSGSCLVNCNIFDFNTVMNDKNRIKEAKRYWKNCFSKEDYISHSDRIIKSDKYWGLDEILYCGIINKSRLKLLGTFDSEKILWYFYEDVIKIFVKRDYLDNYLNILKRINRNQKLIRDEKLNNLSIKEENFILLN